MKTILSESGSSKSKLLHDLVLRLRRAMMYGRLFVHFVWIAGKRMIAQGTDSLSRGDLTSGVMRGEAFLSFIPLNLPAFQRSDVMRPWLMDALEQKDWVALNSTGWFDEAFSNVEGRFIWSPAPCVAEVALEQLCEVKHIHPGTSHIFVCPSLMTSRRRKQLNNGGGPVTEAEDVQLHRAYGGPRLGFLPLPNPDLKAS